MYPRTIESMAGSLSSQQLTLRPLIYGLSSLLGLGLLAGLGCFIRRRCCKKDVQGRTSSSARRQRDGAGEQARPRARVAAA